MAHASNVGSLIASTSNLSNANFLEGRLIFDVPGKPGAGILQGGTITAAQGGLVALVAPHVRNDGLIQAKLGKVVLGSGDTFTIDLFGDQLVSLALSDAHIGQLVDGAGKPVTALINQAGDIDVQGGKAVLLTAGAAKAVVDDVINMSGTIRADTATVDRDGHIVLAGGADTQERTGNIRLVGAGGTTSASGQVLARGKEPGQAGGRIEVEADTLRLADGAHFDAGGVASGGALRLTGLRRIEQTAADVLSRALRTGSNTRIESSRDGDIDIEARLDGRGSNPGAALDIAADNAINVRHDILTDNGAITMTSKNAGIAFIPQSAPLDDTRTEPLLAAGNADIRLSANGNVSVYELITSGDVAVTLTAGDVNLLSQLGYFPGIRLSSLTVRAESSDPAAPGDVFMRDVKVREGGKIDVKAFRNIQVVFGDPDESGSFGLYDAEAAAPDALSLQSALMGDLWASRTWQRAPSRSYTSPGADDDWRTFGDNVSSSEPPALLPPGPTNRLPAAAPLAQIAPNEVAEVPPLALVSAPQSQPAPSSAVGGAPQSLPAAPAAAPQPATGSTVAPARPARPLNAPIGSSPLGAPLTPQPSATASQPSAASPQPPTAIPQPAAATNNGSVQSTGQSASALPQPAPEPGLPPREAIPPSNTLTATEVTARIEAEPAMGATVGSPLPAPAQGASADAPDSAAPRLLREFADAGEGAATNRPVEMAEVTSGGRGIAQVADLGRTPLAEDPTDPFARPDHVVEAPACDSSGAANGYFASDSFGQPVGGACQ